MSTIPDDLLYTATHEWVRMEGELAVMGITHFAQEQLGDLTFVELPAVGDILNAEQEMGVVESVKAASELYSPLDGEVIEVNDELEDAPGLVNDDPYGEGWLIKIAPSGEPHDLLTPDEYRELLEQDD